MFSDCWIARISLGNIGVTAPWKIRGNIADDKRMFLWYTIDTARTNAQKLRVKGGGCVDEQEKTGVADGNERQRILQQMLDCGFAGKENLAALRQQLGVDGDTWEGWLRDGVLPGQVVRLSRSMAEMCAPWVWSSLLKLTEDGSIPAMKLYFDLCKAEVAGGSENPKFGDAEVMRLRREIFGDKAGEGR